MFVADYNTAAAVMNQIYQTRGQIWSLVVPKSSVVADLLTPEEAASLAEAGALHLNWASHRPDEAKVVLTAIGAHQLEQVISASLRLAERDIAHRVVYMLEPGRFRAPRSEGERAHAAPASLRKDLYPDDLPARVFVTHTRPEPLLGTLQPLNTGDRTAALGFVNQGGTLSIGGMMFVNRCTWAHVLVECARTAGLVREDLLNADELAALDGRATPEGVII
jgi:phosphoketolase